jgi:substrate import-associated zinc metallohydrolase lipoprotein
MKTYSKSIILILFAIATLCACSKEEDLGKSNIDVETPNRQGTDKWIYDNFVVPLNLEVKYRWDDSEVEIDKKLVPAEESQVIPFLEVVKKVWIEPYTDKTVVPDETFLKRLSPKQIVLVGSLNYNSDGTITLGTAEGGRKIVLYEVNGFSKTNKEQVLRMLHTMQHEFGHILHQNKLYPAEFKKITPAYTKTWNNYDLETCNKEGFITQYARSSPDEDFVEMIAAMLTMSKTEFDNMVKAIKWADGRNKIREKEQFVVAYYRDKYGIDIYALQQRIADAMASLNAPVTPPAGK